VILVKPELEFKTEALAYRQEHFDNGEMIINGSGLLDKIDSYEQWLQNVKNNADKKTVDKNWVLTDTYFAMDEDKKRIVGIIDLRYELNDFLKDIGNCGYSVRPSERRKGYAGEMLRQVVEKAKKYGLTEIHLSVEKDNIPSIKTILKNNGVYERSFEFEGKKADIYKIIVC
jgi:predicted acetyltransferase